MKNFFLIYFKSAIARKLLFGFGMVILSSMIVVGAVGDAVTRQALLDQADSQLKTTIQMTEKVIQSSIDHSIKNYLKALSEKGYELYTYFYQQYQNGNMSEPDAYRAVKKIFLDPEFGKIGDTGYLAGVNSKGILEVHPYSPGVNAIQHEFMKKAVSMKNGYLEYDWQNKGEDEKRSKAGYMHYFEPWDLIIWASSYKEEFYKLVEIQSLSNEINSISIGKKGYIYVMDLEGNVLIHPELAGQNVYETKDSKTGEQFIKKMIQQFKQAEDKTQIFKTSYHWKNDFDTHVRKKIAYYKYSPKYDLVIVASAYFEDIHAPIQNLRYINTGLFIIIALMIFFAVGLMVSKKMNKIEYVTSIADEICKGDLTKSFDIEGNDEIAQVTNGFKNVLNDFRNLILEVRKSLRILMESTQNISATTQEIFTTSNQQAASVKEVVSTMEDSNSLSKNVQGKIKEVAAIAADTQSNVEEGVDIIQKTLGQMDEIIDSNAQTIEDVKSLGDQINSIWDIVNMINSVADQTKIIAFNAELEASSAGESGKNFEIVASEIRRLADNTVASTREIKNKINEIQHSFDSLILASEEGTGKIKTGWELSKNLEKVFDKILNSSEISSSSANQITESVNHQVASFEQIFETMKQISYAINNFVESTKETNDATNQLDEIVVELNKFVEKYHTE